MVVAWMPQGVIMIARRVNIIATARDDLPFRTQPQRKNGQPSRAQAAIVAKQSFDPLILRHLVVRAPRAYLGQMIFALARVNAPAQGPEAVFIASMAAATKAICQGDDHPNNPRRILSPSGLNRNPDG